MTETDASRVTLSDSLPGESSAAPWKLRYWSVFIGQSLSLVGSALTQFVLLWWVTDTTGSISALGTAGMAALLPQALLGPLGGVYADSHNRQLTMILSDMISAACMVVLIALFQTNNIELWHVYAMMAIRSSMQAFQAPAAAASVSMLVPNHFIQTAAGLTQSVQGVVIMGAAPLGATAISLMPMGWTLGIDVITVVFGVIPLLLYTIPQVITHDNRIKGIWRQFQEGLNVVWHDRAIRDLYGLVSVTVLMIMPLNTLIPLLVKEHFRGGAPQVAIIESITGISMIVGGIIFAAIKTSRKVPWIQFGLMGTCVGIAMAASMPSNMFLMAVIIWGVASIGNMMGNAALMSLLQSTIPNELQGRVISILTTLMGFSAPVGLMIVTPLGQAGIVDARWLFVTFGAIGAVVQLSGLFSASIRGMDDRRPIS